MLFSAKANPNIADSDGRLPLHFSSCAPDIIATLVEHGLDLNAKDKQGNTALHSTSQNEANIEGLRILLQAKVDPLALNKSVEMAFQIVARYGGKEVLSLFLEAGSDVNAHANGSSPPISQACLRQNKRASILQYLLENGADPTISDARSATALHGNCAHDTNSTLDYYSDDITAIKALIQHGADVNARQNDPTGAGFVTPIGVTTILARRRPQHGAGRCSRIDNLWFNHDACDACTILVSSKFSSY
jgi:ankyrin repeat protein